MLKSLIAASLALTSGVTFAATPPLDGPPSTSSFAEASAPKSPPSESAARPTPGLTCDQRYAQQAIRHMQTSNNSATVGKWAVIGAATGLIYMFVAKKTGDLFFLTPTALAVLGGVTGGVMRGAFADEAQFNQNLARAIIELRNGQPGVAIQNLTMLVNTMIYNEGNNSDIYLASLAQVPEATRVDLMHKYNYEKVPAAKVAAAVSNLIDDNLLCPGSGATLSLRRVAHLLLNLLRFGARPFANE